MIKLNGGQALVKMLENLGVEKAFGIPGFQALPYYHAMHHSDKIEHILVRNEQAATFAADAYFRACGKVAVCDGTCGPGATNLATGLAESYAASIPVIAVISSVLSTNSGRGANMEVDQDGALGCFAKATIMIRDVHRIPEFVRKGFHIAVDGKPGPVVIDMPENTYYAEHEFEEEDFVAYETNVCPANRFIPEIGKLDAVAELLKNAKSPVMLCGGGVHNSGAQREVQELAELLGMPVATTISGKGSIAETHPLSLNVYGRYFRFANEYIQAADVILAVGTQLAEMSTIRWSLIPKAAKLIHLEIEPEMISKAYPTEYPLLGDAKATLAQMIKILKEKGQQAPEHPAVIDRIAASAKEWREKAADKIDFEGTPINIAHMLDILSRYTKDDTILVGDGGFAAHWSSCYWNVRTNKERTYIANRGIAAIGYGLPGALGAKVACPDKTVVTLSGDGGLAYSVMELETAVRCKLPIILIVVNNLCLGYIKALEHFQYGEYMDADFIDVKYAEIGKVLGAYGVRVTDPKELAGEFEAAVSRTDKPTVIEVMVTTDPAQMLPGKDNRLKGQK